jgi:beta-lactamase class A
MEAPPHPEHHSRKRNWTLIICSITLLFVVVNSGIAWWHALVIAPQLVNSKAPAEAKSQYDLIRPDLAALDVKDFLEVQHQGTISMIDLKKSIVEVVSNPSLQGTYAIYVEDLTTGSWVGLNEREKYFPASLAKMPIIVAIYKQIQEGTLTLNQAIVIESRDIDTRFGPLAFTESGASFTIADLIKYALVQSDNTAARALLRQLTVDEVMEARLAMGLDWPKAQDDVTRASPKEYANMFRSLYVSSYLRRAFSNEILSLLADTPFDEQLAAGLPTGVRMSHKYGVTTEEDSTHDCGIVYLPNHHYLICAMSKGAGVEEANQVIALLSKETYEYMSLTH